MSDAPRNSIDDLINAQTPQQTNARTPEARLKPNVLDSDAQNDPGNTDSDYKLKPGILDN